MDLGYGGVFDVGVEYKDLHVEEASHRSTQGGWILIHFGTDLGPALATVIDLERRGTECRLILVRPNGHIPMPTIPRHRSYPVEETSAPAEDATLLDKYGHSGVNAVVDNAYLLFVNDDALGKIFAHYTVPEIKAKVKATFVIVLGAGGTAKEEAEVALGLTPGTGSISTLRDHIRQIHSHLNLSHRMFVKVCTGFYNAAIAARVSEADANAIYEALMSFEDVVVTV